MASLEQNPPRWERQFNATTKEYYSPEELIPKYLQPDEEIVRPDRVKIVPHGVYIVWVIDEYMEMYRQGKASNIIGKTAVKFDIPDAAVVATMQYYVRNQNVLDAALLLKREEAFDAEHINAVKSLLEQVTNQKDNLFKPQKHR